jgi:biopolymer transport protein ExbD
MSENQTPEEDSSAVNQLPIPAEFENHDGNHKKKKRHAAHEHPTDVNINSLLDVLSVILVFLMKSYSANTVQVKPSPDLQVPMSWSAQQAQESTAVTVTLKDIMVDDAPVMQFEAGKVPEQDRSSGGFLIDPLFQKLQEAVDHQKKIAQFNKKAEFKGLVTIIADRNVPFSLLTQVMYTAGQAQFSKFKFAAVKTER